MNQILFYKSKNYNKKSHKKNKFIFFISIFVVSSTLIACIIYYCINHFRISHINSEFSDSLSDTVRIQALYKDTISNNSKYPIIGRIEIEKLNLNYPIFSFTNDDLLKLGICKLYGPIPNSKGNLCLAGHNYDNNKFFSNLYKLNLNDIITIYDSSNISVDYEVFNIFEVDSSNTSILDQVTHLKELTLITCNNFNKNRIIVKAKEIE